MNATRYEFQVNVFPQQLEESALCLLHTILFHRTTGKFKYQVLYFLSLSDSHFCLEKGRIPDRNDWVPRCSLSSNQPNICQNRVCRTPHMPSGKRTPICPAISIREQNTNARGKKALITCFIFPCSSFFKRKEVDGRFQAKSPFLGRFGH